VVSEASNGKHTYTAMGKIATNILEGTGGHGLMAPVEVNSYAINTEKKP
jgi:hypothetical protein